MLPMFWFTGVVEDRFDPEEMGRVRVRIFGQHTDDIAKIPTMDLPWANVMMPVTSASISGVGYSPTGLVEGSWVVGFFADGENCQDPIIMGSIPGKPTQPANELKAFKDAGEKYPRWLNDSDVSYVARGKWASHYSYQKKDAQRNTEVESSSAPKLSTIAQDNAASYYERKTWDEPKARDGIGGDYPYVHVFETEQGILREYDDSPGAPRIHEFHPSGTFYEIYPEGKKVSKVVSDNYTIIFGKDHVLIQGDAQITIEGDCQQLVKGDYTVEVGGDYNVKVHGNRNTKVTKNDNIEIIGNYNINISESMIQRVAKNQTLLVDVDKTETIGGKSDLAVTSSVNYTFLDTLSIFSNGNQSISTNGSQQLLSKSGLDFASQSDWNLTCGASVNIQTTGSFNNTVNGSFNNNITGAFNLNAATIALS
jgi:hypothetical protein